MAVALDFSVQRTGELDIVVAEMVSNLSKYGQNGQLLVKPVEEGGLAGLEVISVDTGPGMENVSKMITDGYSTTNTLGHGLGSIKRLADVFQVYSQKGWGTIVLARIFKERLPDQRKAGKADIRSLILPKSGETACGDGFYARTTKESLKLILGDGLGHGPDAAQAVNEAIKAFKICPDESPVDIIRFISTQVKRTRGLVATVAVFNFKEKVWRICGVGNIATRISGTVTNKNYIAYNGIVGMNIPNSMNDQVIAYERGQHIILCSDGIKTKWDVSKLPGLFRCDLSIVAAALYKDYARHTDDLSIAVGKINL